ncbi:MAG: hypothetical protein JWM47_3672 [Acidimicrobiales bacterium]|nr:hypothetical protein [Acidimicrobiales bacterium]
MRKVLAAAGLAVAALGAVACEPVPPGPVTPPGAINISMATIGGSPIIAWSPLISADGRYGFFRTNSTGVVPGFAPLKGGIYRLDRTTGTTVAINVSPTGQPSNEQGTSSGPVLADVSTDGRYVLFDSDANNLTNDPNPPTTRRQIFLRDMVTGTTTRVSAPSGVTPNGTASGGVISPDGGWVVFPSTSYNLFPGDAYDGELHYFAWNRTTGALTNFLHGRDATGAVALRTPKSAGTMVERVSNDGRVFFQSKVSNLQPGVVAAPSDYFIYMANPATDVITRVSSESAILSDVSADGRYVVYRRSGAQLTSEAMILDRTTGKVEAALTTITGGPTGSGQGHISDDGRFVIANTGLRVADIVPGDTTVGGTFMRDRQTGAVYRLSRRPDGTAASDNNVQEIDISNDGRTYSFKAAGPQYLTGVTSGPWAVRSRTPLP